MNNSSARIDRQPTIDGGPVVENPAFTAFAARIISAAGRRVSRGDIGALPELVALRDDLEDAITAAVRSLHYQHEHSWSAIGRELGVSKQAAAKAYAQEHT